MAETENSKDLLSVLWAGADILRGKMDANEYKNYLLGIVFYKYLSDTFLTHVYDLLNDKKPESMTEAQAAYEQAYETEDRDDLLEDIKESYHYTIEPELTYTKLAEAANNNAFQREMLKKAFNNVEQSDPIFANLFADVDLYSTRLVQVSRSSLRQFRSLSRKSTKWICSTMTAMCWAMRMNILSDSLRVKRARKPENSTHRRQFRRFSPVWRFRGRKISVVCSYTMLQWDPVRFC